MQTDSPGQAAVFVLFFFPPFNPSRLFVKCGYLQGTEKLTIDCFASDLILFTENFSYWITTRCHCVRQLSRTRIHSQFISQFHTTIDWFSGTNDPRDRNQKLNVLHRVYLTIRITICQMRCLIDTSLRGTSHFGQRARQGNGHHANFNNKNFIIIKFKRNEWVVGTLVYTRKSLVRYTCLWVQAHGTLFQRVFHSFILLLHRHAFHSHTKWRNKLE